TQVVVREAEMKAKNFPLEIEITTSVIRDRAQRAVSIEAVFRNAGAGSLKLSFTEPAFQLARVRPTSSGAEEVSFVAEGSPAYLSHSSVQPIPYRRLLAEQRRRIPYVFKVPEPGLYLVQVSVGY